MADLLGRSTFIGRVPELARLQGLLRGVGRGAGRTVVVAGEAGIGKSRLLARFDEAARDDGALVLVGACLETADDGVPYAPFVEILRDLVRATPAGRLPALLGPARAELGRLIPELATRAADVPAPSDADRAGQARLFELILGVLERLAAERPVVVEIEDVHWADRSTRELLDFLVRSLRDDPALIVLTLRTDEAGVPVGNLALVAEIEREEHVDRLDVVRFGREEVEQQLAGLLGEPPDPALVDRLLARSDGNPFYVEELILAGGNPDRDIPPVLRDVVAERIGTLSEPARGVLRAAATAGRRIDDELLAAVLELPLRTLADALREAVAAGVLVRGEFREGPAVEFRHALLQEVVSAELFPGERLALHARLAEALERRVAEGRDVSPSEIARHWDGARRPDRALGPTIRSAEAAERVYAFGEASRLWARADALATLSPAAAASVPTRRDEMLERAADAAVLAGDYRTAVSLGEAALAIVDADREPVRAGHLHERLRWYLWESGDRKAAAEAVEAALRLLPAGVPSVARARALAQHAGILLYAGAYGEAVRQADASIAESIAADAPDERGLALGVLGWSLAVLGDVEAGIERFREGREIGERLGDVEGMALAAANLASLLDRIGRTQQSLEAAAAGYATTERLGVARTYGGLLLGFRAKAEFALGRWDEALASTELGLRRGATDRVELFLLTVRARLFAARGQYDESAKLLRRARGIEDRLGGTEWLGWLLVAEAELAAWESRLAVVREAAAHGVELAARGGLPDPALAWLAAALLRAEADAAAASRSRLAGPDPAAAATLAWIDAAVESAATTRELLAGSTRGMALLEQLRAERARLAHDKDSGLPTRWAAIAAGWAEAGRPYPAAYARYREGESLLASRGDRAAAAASLGAAAQVAGNLVAGPLLGLITTLARQARLTLDGASVQTPGVDGGDGADAIGLTERETEVLQLVAAGWSNQDIADALFITRKTASVHVSNIMGKLGVASRVAAAATAHRLGLAGDQPSPRDGHRAP